MPAVRVGPLPGYAPVPPLVMTPPDAMPAPIRPLTVDNRGNRGDPLWMRSGRARQNARRADPQVTERLADIDWEAHHLINAAGIKRAPELFRAAAQAGWRADDASNVAPLPASRAAQERLQAQGLQRPLHDSGHRDWNEKVGVAIKALRAEFKDRDLNAPEV